MWRWFALAGLGGLFWTGTAQADPLAPCRAGNPQFPQLCECAIERAQAEGIDGPVLDRLLANRWDDVPIDVANRYGLIIVECTQATVTGGAIAIPASPIPQQENAPTHGGAPTAASEQDVTAGGTAPSDPAPMVSANDPASALTEDSLQGVPAGYRIGLNAAPGTWASGRLDTPYGQALVQVVRNTAGRHLALRCDPGALPILILGPFDDGIPGQGAQIVVQGTGGINGRLFQQGTQLMGFNRNYLAVGVTSQQFLDALRRGNTVEIRLEDGRTETFGLRESSRVIGESACRVGRPPAWLYTMGWESTRHDPWQMGQARDRNKLYRK